MKKDLLPSEGQFYKANLHAHTTLSDGHLMAQQLKDAYKAASYAVVAYTDHRRYVHHTELDDADFLAIAAYEVDISRPAPSFNHVKTITEARFPLSGNGQYIRVDCRDDHGFHACSNAYWADTLFR